MSCARAILCILLPPLAVLDKGCGSILIVTLLTLAGWVPGVLAALVICNNTRQR
jgi:uncharacterized membrane protein YqaE (UPF0057 family)